MTNVLRELLAASKSALPHLHWANGHGDRCDEAIVELQTAICKAEATKLLWNLKPPFAKPKWAREEK